MISKGCWTVAEGASAWVGKQRHRAPIQKRDVAAHLQPLTFIYLSFKSAPQAIKRCTETNGLLLLQVIRYKRRLEKDRGFICMAAKLARGGALDVFLAVFAVAYLLQGVRTPFCQRKHAARCWEELGSARLRVCEPLSRSRQTSHVERWCRRLVPGEEAQEPGSVPHSAEGSLERSPAAGARLRRCPVTPPLPPTTSSTLNIGACRRPCKHSWSCSHGGEDRVPSSCRMWLRYSQGK